MSHQVLRASAATEVLLAAVPGLYAAAERAAAHASKALLGLPADRRDQAYADIFRAFMADELDRITYASGASFEAGNRNSMILSLNEQKSIICHVLRAATKAGTPPVAGSRTRQLEFEQLPLSLDTDEHDDSLVSFVLTWDTTPAGIVLTLTLPNQAHATRFSMATHWCSPLPYPEIEAVKAAAADYPDELDDYRPRTGLTGEAHDDDEGGEPA